MHTHIRVKINLPTYHSKQVHDEAKKIFSYVKKQNMQFE